MTAQRPLPTPISGHTAGVLAAIRDLWESGREETSAKLDRLEDAVAALAEGRLDEPLREETERIAHKFAGSLGTFGYGRGSELARVVERTFETMPAPSEVPHLARLLRDLRAETIRPFPEDDARDAPSAPTTASLLIVDDAYDVGERLALEGRSRGLAVAVAHDPAEAERILENHAPDVTLLDLTFPEGSGDPLELLSTLCARTPPVPVLILTGSDALTDRVEVARRGGRGFLHKTLPASEVLDAVVDVLDRARAAQPMVLAADDDEMILAALRVLLEREGVRFEGVTDPSRFWDALTEFAPDLLVLDVDMPGVNGIELCRAVRAAPRWSTLPIVFLTALSDRATVHEMFASGADDYVSKPIIGPELLTRINNRLERIALYRTLADRDALTGVPNRRKSTESIERLLKLSERYDQPVSLAMLDVDHFKHVNDEYGHTAGDDVLRRLGRLLSEHFRGEDVVGRWGGEEFALGMYGISKRDGRKRIEDALAVVGAETFMGPNGETFRITFSAGIAEYPRDGRDLHALYQAADEALAVAKRTGRNAVLPASAGVGPTAPSV